MAHILFDWERLSDRIIAAWETTRPTVPEQPIPPAPPEPDRIPERNVEWWRNATVTPDTLPPGTVLDADQLLANLQYYQRAQATMSEPEYTIGRLRRTVEALEKRVAELEAKQAPGVRFLQKQKPD